MKRILTTAALLTAFSIAPALADPIEGKWRVDDGETVAISQCGGSYCITVKTGKYAGKGIGKMSGSNGKYSGSITDPKNDKTYSGNATLSGNSLKMQGCVLKVLCRSQNWKRI